MGLIKPTLLRLLMWELGSIYLCSLCAEQLRDMVELESAELNTRIPRANVLCQSCGSEALVECLYLVRFPKSWRAFHNMCVLSQLVVSDSLQPHDCSLPGSTVHGTSKARILEWIAISFFRGSSQPRDRTWLSCVSCIAGGLFTHWAIREAPEPLGNYEGNDNLGSLWDTLRVYRNGRGWWRGERNIPSFTPLHWTQSHSLTSHGPWPPASKPWHPGVLQDRSWLMVMLNGWPNLELAFPTPHTSDVPELLSNEITSLRNVPRKPNHTAVPFFQLLFITDFPLPTTHWRVPVLNVHAKLSGPRNVIKHYGCPRFQSTVSADPST